MQTFKELYGFDFGTKAKLKARPNGPFTFTTPNHSEEDVRFFLDLFSMLMGVIVVDIFNEDGSLRFTKTFDSENRGHLTMFVNQDGVDPKAGRPTGHPGIAPAEPRDAWLEPNTTYTCDPHRPGGPSERQPIGLIYSGTDDNEVDYAVDSGFRIFDDAGQEYVLVLKS